MSLKQVILVRQDLKLPKGKLASQCSHASVESVLRSDKDKNLYFGYTTNLNNRIKEHNSGLVKSTKSRIPLRCVYYEAYASKNDAIKREHNLKLRAKAVRQLLIRVQSSLKS